MSDKLLWSRLKAGEHDALETIYREHFPYLYNYGRKIISDEGIVEDSIQDLFIEIWNKRTGLSNTDAIRPYLTVSLRRKLIRAQDKSRKIDLKEPSDMNFAAELSIDTLLINKEIDEERKKKLEAGFKELSSRQKEVLYLKYYSEMDYKDISEAMELNYQSARNLVSRALQKLSKYVQLVLLIFILGK
ncbi:MAG: RNA polymerase sigma factor (sigma-70 family) [Saprospiraceae bacterium]|jgi:RNA polymerase sigma factor (sigma-70 family)